MSYFVLLGLLGLATVIGFCAWAAFREPWDIRGTRRQRRAWEQLTAAVQQRSRQLVEPAPAALPPLAELVPEPAVADGAMANRPAVPQPSDEWWSQLGDEELRASSGDVHIDLSLVIEVGYENFLRLIQAKDFLEERGRRLVITGVDVTLQPAFEASGLDTFVSAETERDPATSTEAA